MHTIWHLVQDKQTSWKLKIASCCACFCSSDDSLCSSRHKLNKGSMVVLSWIKAVMSNQVEKSLQNLLL